MAALLKTRRQLTPNSEASHRVQNRELCTSQSQAAAVATAGAQKLGLDVTEIANAHKPRFATYSFRIRKHPLAPKS
jgi:hypothetical protein